MRIRYTRRAQADLVAILDYIDERNSEGADRVKHAIHRAIELVGEYPQIGRRTEIESVRVIPVTRYPYLIYWSLAADEVRLLHIRHAARQPWQEEP